MIFDLAIVKLCVSVISLGSMVDATFTRIYQPNAGSVMGQFDYTVGQRMKYASFLGIPYAEPPVGDLRFKPPVKLNHFGFINANNDNHVCTQYDVETSQVIGDENCLRLNIYTPEISNGSESRSDRAVMVWIHGGAFMWGSKKKSYFGPDFLIEKDVVVVSINYRLGAFGFLAVGKKISGNMGLKDQAMALQWVKENIAAFGGDPDKITIFGESAGAVSVELHRLSPKSRGLFRGSIAMSGSPLNPWAFTSTHDSHDMSKEFIKSWSKDWGNDRSEHMDFSFSDAFLDELVDFVRIHDEDEPNRKEIYQKLQDATSEKIALTTHQLMNSQVAIPFLPTIESSDLSHAFITRKPKDIITSGQCNAVPHILGYTDSEFVGIAPIFKEMYKKLHGLRYVVEAAASDAFFEEGIDQTRKYLNQYYSNSRVWQYVNGFDYEQSLHRVAGLSEPGCGHADDIAHLFYTSGKNQPTDSRSVIGTHRNIMTTLWTNFAKYLNPTPNQRNEWTPTASSNMRLKIDSTNRLVLEQLPGSTSDEIFSGIEEYFRLK